MHDLKPDSVELEKAQQALEPCLDAYADDLTLAESALAEWQIVRNHLPLFPVPKAKEIGLAVRAALDEVIESLRQNNSADAITESAAARRFTIADRLYRKGERPGEIYNRHLAISKSQFYRERADLLVVLAERLLQAEERAIRRKRAESAKKLALLPPKTSMRLVGVDYMTEPLLRLVLGQEQPGIILLHGLGGLGKTAIARDVVEKAWLRGGFDGIAWINAQGQTWDHRGVVRQENQRLNIDDLCEQLFSQLNQSMMSADHLFSWLAESTPQGDDPTYDDILDAISAQHEAQQTPPESRREKLFSILKMLWATPTLIVVDGLEDATDLNNILDVLGQLVARSQARVIITSRLRAEQSLFVRPLHLREIAPASAVVLTKQYAYERGINSVERASSDALSQIVETTGSNPLALRVFVDHLATLPLTQISADFEVFGPISRALVDFIYASIWGVLADESRRLLAQIAKHPADLLTWDILQNLSKAPVQQLITLVQSLINSNLLQKSDDLQPHYRLSSLTRRFVRAMAKA
jgi:NB-ARC domain